MLESPAVSAKITTKSEYLFPCNSCGTSCYNQVAGPRDTSDVEGLHECLDQQWLDFVSGGQECRVVSHLRSHGLWISAGPWGSGYSRPVWHHSLPPAERTACSRVVHKRLGRVACITHQGGSTIFSRNYCKTTTRYPVVPQFQSNYETTICWWYKTKFFLQR